LKSRNIVEETFEKVKETTAPVIDKVENFTGHAKETVTEHSEKAE
jgi:hypothetical protein